MTNDAREFFLNNIYIGRHKLHTSDKKVEIYITVVSVRFIDPFEHEGATIGDQDIELQKNNLDFVDDVRLVNGDKFKKRFF